MYIFFRGFFMNLLLWTSLLLNFEMPNTRKHRFFLCENIYVYEDYTNDQFSVNHVFRLAVPGKVMDLHGNRYPHVASPACDHWSMWITWLSGGMGHEAEWSYFFYAGEKNTKNSYFNTWNYPEKNIQEHNLIISFQWMIKKFLVPLSFHFLKTV